MKKMENKVAVVTGGNRGIAYATAKEFLTQGAKVIITGRNKQFVDSASKGLGITGIVYDQSDTKDAFHSTASVPLMKLLNSLRSFLLRTHLILQVPICI